MQALETQLNEEKETSVIWRKTLSGSARFFVTCTRRKLLAKEKSDIPIQISTFHGCWLIHSSNAEESCEHSFLFFWSYLFNFIIIFMSHMNEWWTNMPSWIELLNVSSEIRSILFQLIYLWQNASLIVFRLQNVWCICEMRRIVDDCRLGEVNVWLTRAIWHTYRQLHLHPSHG